MLVPRFRDQVGEVRVQILLKSIFHHYQHHIFQISILSIFQRKRYQEPDEDFQCSRSPSSMNRKIHRVPSNDGYRILGGFFSYFLHYFY